MAVVFFDWEKLKTFFSYVDYRDYSVIFKKEKNQDAR